MIFNYEKRIEPNKIANKYTEKRIPIKSKANGHANV